MSIFTHPDYTADTEANVTAQVSDSENGTLCWAAAEQSLWQLSKISVLPLGPNVLATQSGVGRWLRMPTAASGSSNSTLVDFDFSAGPPQQTTVQVAVAAAWVTADMSFSESVVDTATHTAEDAAAEGLVVRVLNIVPGVGFDALAVVQDGTNGTYRVRITGVLRMALQIRGGTSAVVAETDANGNLFVNTPTDIDLPGFVATASEVDPGTVAAAISRTVRPDDTSADFRKRVGLDTPQFIQAFAGAVVDTLDFQQNVSTMTIAQSGGFLRLNSGSAVAAGNFANHYTYRTFSQQGTMPIYAEAQIKYVATALQAGVRAEFGLMTGPTGTAVPTDGAFFRYNNSSLLGVLSYGGSETPAVIDPSLVPAVNDTAHYLVALYSDYVEYWIDNILCARIPAPSSNASITSTPTQVFATRLQNTALAASAVQIHIGRISVDLGDAFSGQSWGGYAVGNGGGGYQTQPGSAVGQTAAWANSAAPAAGTLSNTALPAASYNTLGGLFDLNAPAGAATDYIVFAYQVPAATSALPGKNYFLKRVVINTYNDVVAVATTGSVLLWGVAVGSTALSLATADATTTKSPKRAFVGQHTFLVGDPVGKGAAEGRIELCLDDGMMAEPGTFVHVILRVPTGTATATERFKGGVGIFGYFI